MKISDAQRRQQQKQLERVKAELEERALPPLPEDPPVLPRDEAERRALVEQRIQEAIAAGAFDNLPGKGKPLRLNANPYLDSGQELAFGLLKNNGFAPDWIERDKEIRREINAFRQKLAASWEQCRRNPSAKANWQAALARLESQAQRLNRKIDDFNLVVPIVSKQRRRIKLSEEIHRVQQTGG